MLDPAVLGGMPGYAEPTAALIDALPAARELARSRTTDCAVVVLPNGLRVVRKRWRWPRAADRAKGVLRTTVAARSPAEREFMGLVRLRNLRCGPFAPRPFGWTEERRLGVLVACTLLVEEVPGAVDLATFLRDSKDRLQRRSVLADLGRRTHAMHDAGLRDGEHHPRNVLVLPGPRTTLRIDCAKQRAGRRAVRWDSALRDLAALDVALVRFGSEEERTILVRHWLGHRRGAISFERVLRRVAELRAAIEPREARRLPPPTTA